MTCPTPSCAGAVGEDRSSTPTMALGGSADSSAQTELEQLRAKVKKAEEALARRLAVRSGPPPSSPGFEPFLEKLTSAAVSGKAGKLLMPAEEHLSLAFKEAMMLGRFTDPHLLDHTHTETLRKTHVPVKASTAADLYARFTDTDVNGFHDGSLALQAMWDATPGFEGCGLMFRTFLRTCV